MPAVTLWNPYTHDLVCPAMHLSIAEFLGNTVIEFKFSVEGDPDVQDVVYNSRSMPFTIPAVTIPAGQSVVFSAPDGPPVYYPADDYFNYIAKANVSDRNILAPGFRQGTAFVGLTGITSTLVDENTPGADLPRLKFSFSGAPQLNLSFSEASALLNWSNRRYQCLTGLRANRKIGTSNIQFYQPAAAVYPDPKLLYKYTMPFADSKSYVSAGVNQPIAWSSVFNPRGVVHSFTNVALGYRDLPTYPGGYYADNDAESFNAVETWDSAGENGFVGISTSGSGAREAVLYNIPQSPLSAMAQLAHANIAAPVGYANEEAYRKIGRAHGGQLDAMMDVGLGWSSAGDYHTPSYAIGSSQMPPYLPDAGEYTHLYDDSISHQQRIWDYSYLLNDVLFDKYFFSTVPQTGGIVWPLLNPLVQPVGNPSNASLRDFDDAAQHLLYEGGFNINSTSVLAWAAFLSAMRETDFAGDGQTGAFFTRFDRPAGLALQGVDLGVNEADAVTGYHRLTDDIIIDLAERIIEQVKLRGPFPSLSAFVNRVLDTGSLRSSQMLANNDAPDPYAAYGSGYSLEDMVQLKGGLHAALELSEANKPFHDNPNYLIRAGDLAGGSSLARAFAGSVGAHLPAYTSQVDLLSRLGASMFARSDSFVIRVVGESDNLPGQPQSRVYAEARVQRTINYIDPVLNAPDEIPVVADAVNQRFGRRFEIVDFRWLPESDI
jgi:hypothetical protein